MKIEPLRFVTVGEIARQEQVCLPTARRHLVALEIVADGVIIAGTKEPQPIFLESRAPSIRRELRTLKLTR